MQGGTCVHGAAAAVPGLGVPAEIDEAAEVGGVVVTIERWSREGRSGKEHQAESENNTRTLHKLFPSLALG